MSIQSFLDSAQILYDNKKYEEALCLACIAIDACSYKQYPNEGNAKRYKSFLKEHFSTICRYGFPGVQANSIRIKVNVPNVHLKTDKNGYVDMEQIIYHVIRCGLVHECNIEKTIQFTDTTRIGDWNNKFYIPKDIIWGLIAAVKE
ncbi:hypothetical protein [uncultured Clostridium sp.]|uniref:hypothetical protein n=1 Tax=uncultured Clostridium sp. TaxID=59620 RepID=UPI0025DC164C|nr:hypothetical protein [uncultured Clostridium sp.]